MRQPLSVAYVIDPRFPGGTSAAVASELKVVSGLGSVSVHAVKSKMFGDKSVAPQILTALNDLGQELIWDSPLISADIVLIHNPAFLKFQKTLDTRIVAKHLIVIAHENFYRPGKVEGFDVEQCLNTIDRAALALSKSIAPISPYNRNTIDQWFKSNCQLSNWAVLQDDWFNICEFEALAPTRTPTDRRGRHSRPGMEKFPILPDMDRCFPEHAKANVILGADLFLLDDLQRRHWAMYPFRGLEVAQYFEMIDFMVYFTAPTWRESFGRVMAEAIAAGKVVISDPGTASVFRGAVIPAAATDVNEIISRLIAKPDLYSDQVIKAQSTLKNFSSHAFERFFHSVVDQKLGALT